MRANLRHALQRRTPTGRDIGGVIMGCRADLSRDAAAESLGGDSLGLLPQARNRRARQRSVACERELASGGTGRSLKNDSAYRQIGRAHVRTPVTNAHLVCRLLLEKKKKHQRTDQQRDDITIYESSNK